MAGYRIHRINEEMSKELAEILRTVKDPRVSGSFISITGVDCTPDLKYAKIWFSAIGKRSDAEEIRKGLVSAHGYIRRCLAERLNLRMTPELSFIHDESLEHGAHITKLLHGVEEELRESDRRAAEAISEGEENEE